MRWRSGLGVGRARRSAHRLLRDLGVVAGDDFEAAAVEFDGFAGVGDATELFDEMAVEAIRAARRA